MARSVGTRCPYAVTAWLDHMLETFHLRRFCALLAFAALIFGALQLTACSSGDGADVVVAKSPNDDRDYRYVVLNNHLRVLLVSDPGTDKAAASLTVLRGSYDEPPEYPGLAHFLEHMLFLGTKKYPDVDGYQHFVATHGGSSNAYTAADHTNFFFDINPEQFPDAMDRFSQFFIAPLLDPAYVDREKNAVNSEWQLQIKDDGWREFAATKAAMNPDYPGARFNIGNLETLSDGVDDALLRFFHHNYSADQMVLVALSNESLDTMESWVRPMFSAIENHNIGPSRVTTKAFLADQLPALLRVRTLKDEYSVSFSFPIPPTEPYYRKKPAQYLANLLGHEGEGSLHQALTERGWITSLGAGATRLDDANAYLGIEIGLTDAGRNALPEISRMLFGYIDLLKATDPEKWRYDEQALSAELNFRFQEKSSATAFVYLTGPALGLYPPEDVLIAPYLMEEFDPTLIESYLDYLTPDNVVVTVSGPDVQTDRVERWFDVPYSLERGRLSTAAPMLADMHLPAPNPFLPEHLGLLKGDEKGPMLAVDRPGLQLWLDVDVEFSVPRANQYFTLGMPGGLVTPEDLVRARLYERLVTDSLNEFTYPAQLAGLGYQLDVTPAGFRLGVRGFDDKQLILLDAVMDRFVSLEIDPERFALFQRELARDWRNFRNERPYTQVYAALPNVMVSGSFPPERLADAVEKVTVADLQAWRERRLAAFSVIGLSHGNVNAERLEDVAKHLQQYVKLGDFEVLRPQVARLDQSYLLGLDVDHGDAAMVLYVQDDEASYADRALSALAAQMLKQEYFTSLRTQQQLGYVVALANRTMQNRGGLVFVIQSPVASPAALEDATRRFVNEQVDALPELSEASFEQYKAGLVHQLTEKDRNLNERTTRYLADLDVDETGFDSQARIADIVAGLTLADMQAYYKELKRKLEERRLLIYCLGRFEDAPTEGVRLEGIQPLPAPMAAQATSSR